MVPLQLAQKYFNDYTAKNKTDLNLSVQIGNMAMSFCFVDDKKPFSAGFLCDKLSKEHRPVVIKFSLFSFQN